MRNLFLTLFSITILCAGCGSDSDNDDNKPLKEKQVTLYDKSMEPIAYIDYDDDSVIYMIEGEPVGYLEVENQVFSFNGKLLGWYSDGVLYANYTYDAVGAKHGIVRGEINTLVTYIDKIKGIKQIQPIKSFEEDSYDPPVLIDSWSETTLTDFLMPEKNKENRRILDDIWRTDLREISLH